MSQRRRTSIRFAGAILMALAVALSFAVAPTSAAATTWQTVKIDPHGHAAWLAIDPQGHHHIVYQADGTTCGLPQCTGFFVRYATDASGSWVVTDLTPLDDGRLQGIAVDQSGVVHILYQQQVPFGTGPTSLYHVTLDAGTLGSPEKIAEDSTHASMALDRSGAVHVVLDDGATVSYTTNAGGSWSALQPIPNDSSAATPLRPLIAIAPRGTIEVGIDESTLNCSFCSGGSYLATLVGSSWNVEKLPFGQASGSIAIDDFGGVHFVYDFEDTSGISVGHTTKSRGTWHDETIATNAFESSAVWARGLLQVTYTVAATDLVTHATLTGSTWTFEPGLGTYVSGSEAIGVDASGRVAIVYDTSYEDPDIGLTTNLYVATSPPTAAAPCWHAACGLSAGAGLPWVPHVKSSRSSPLTLASRARRPQ